MTCETSYGQKPKPDAPRYRLRDTLFAWLSVFVCYLFVRALPFSYNTMGGFLFFLALYTLGLIYLRVSGRALRPALSWLLPLFSVGLITSGNDGVRTLLSVASLFAFFFGFADACGLCGKGLFDDTAFLRIFYVILDGPIMGIRFFLPALFRKREKNAGNNPTLGYILVGLAIAVMPTLIIILLLSYDQSFTSLLKSTVDALFGDLGKTFRDFIFAFLLGFLLFGGMFSFLFRAQNGYVRECRADGCRIVPRATVAAAVTPILAVYLLFFVSQWDYYLSAFTHKLPDGLTFAEYAREGFFQLCAVCAINAVILLLIQLVIKRDEGERGVLRRVYSALVAGFSLILGATALAKMVLYIHSYGLTRKRVYASWLILLLGAVFLIVLFGQFLKKPRLAPVILAVVLLFSMGIALPDVDGAIADYNVDRYLAEKLKTVDVAALEDIGTPAIPALCRLAEECDDPPAVTSDALGRLEKALPEETVFTFNFSDLRARRALEKRNGDS